MRGTSILALTLLEPALRAIEMLKKRKKTPGRTAVIVGLKIGCDRSMGWGSRVRRVGVE